MNKIPAWKEKEVERLTDLLTDSSIVGVVDIEGIPALQMQQMRAKLRGTVELTVSRNTLIEKALKKVEEDRKDIEELNNHLHGQTAIVSTDLNPFKLFKRMEATKTKAPARGGEEAPENIKVEKGETPFKPGPIVGDLQKAGIPASIQGGKVVINTNKTVVKKGETISPGLATMLNRLDIHPITVGLDLRVVYEDGMLFDRDTLDIDASEYIDMIKKGASSTFNLSVNAEYPTKQNIGLLLSKASRDALSLALNSDLIVSETVKIKLTEAHKNMLSLAAKIDPGSLDEELLEVLGIDMDKKDEDEIKEETVTDDTEKQDQDKEE